MNRRHFYVEHFGIKFIEESLEADENFEKLFFQQAQDYNCIPYNKVISSKNYCNLQYYAGKLADFSQLIVYR
jgi:hypothetical protein